MNIQEYIEKRVDDQINWYDEKSRKAQKWYKGLQLLEIIIAALISLLSGYTEHSYIPLIIGISGAVIAVIEAVTKLNNYHENWIQYRTTCEMLKYQKHLFITGSSPYNNGNETIASLFVHNIENIISSENNQWKNLNIQKNKVIQNSKEKIN